MLINDNRMIGNNLLAKRKQLGLTQAEVAEAAGLSDRTYADIERGSANMRTETLIRICRALRVTPNDILTTEPEIAIHNIDELITKLSLCTPKQQKGAFQILSIYLESL